VDPAEVFEAGLEQHHLANTAYPIAHKKTIWRHRQPADRHRSLLHGALCEPMGLYIHIPFCERRCAFCEYCVVKQHSPDREARYHEALLGEMQLYLDLLGRRQPRSPLVGLDIGGGTPSLVEPGRIAQLIEKVVAGFRLEPTFGISIETTPKIAALHPERLAAYRSMGIERISMGLQMINPRLLHDYGRDLNRIGHNRAAVDNIRQAGFRRFNIDLMYGFARQSVDDVRRCVEYTVALQPEYVTLYRMRYKGTRIHTEAAQVALDQVTEMYEAATQMLLAAGYAAQPGKNAFSRVVGDPGTSEYLTSRVMWGMPYLGLGLGAQTFTGGLLSYNLGAADKRLDRYVEVVGHGRLPVQDLYQLPPAEGMAKMIAVSFYFGQIHLEAFRRRFGVALEQRFAAEVELLLGRNLMEHHDPSGRTRQRHPRAPGERQGHANALCPGNRAAGPVLRMTKLGALQFNGVVALFYSDAVKRHLIELSQRRGAQDV